MQQLGQSYGLDRPRVRWPETVIQAVGGDLFMLMIKTITFDRDRDKNVVVGGKWLDSAGREREPVGKVVASSPGLHKVFRPRKAFEVEETKPDPSIWALYSVIKKVELEFTPESVPMFRAFLWVLIEDIGPHEDLFCEMVLIWSSLEHQVLICSSSSWSGMTLKKVCIFL